MSKLITNINAVALKECCLCNCLTHNLITPPPHYWLKPSVDNGQRTTGSCLCAWSLLVKKFNYEFNFNKSYLKILAKRGLMLCLVVFIVIGYLYLL